MTVRVDCKPRLNVDSRCKRQVELKFDEISYSQWIQFHVNSLAGRII